ncbi:low molecular weight protein-tyrosine-phosphatase [Kaarinaea lacus]
MVKVLFVCMGNICRSPTAEGVFQKLIHEQGLNDVIEIDSAGTHAYHVGEPPDTRAQHSALGRGIDISQLRARKAKAKDFDYFDFVLAMDNDNYRALAEICPAGMEHKLRLFLDYAPHLHVREVPDPYYGGAKGFDLVLDMVEEAAHGLLQQIRDQHL